MFLGKIMNIFKLTLLASFLSACGQTSNTEQVQDSHVNMPERDKDQNRESEKENFETLKDKVGPEFLEQRHKSNQEALQEIFAEQGEPAIPSDQQNAEALGRELEEAVRWAPVEGLDLIPILKRMENLRSVNANTLARFCVLTFFAGNFATRTYLLSETMAKLKSFQLINVSVMLKFVNSFPRNQTLEQTEQLKENLEKFHNYKEALTEKIRGLLLHSHTDTLKQFVLEELFVINFNEGSLAETLLDLLENDNDPEVRARAKEFFQRLANVLNP